MNSEELLETMKANLEAIYEDDVAVDLSNIEMYLLERTETFVDLYHFLTTVEQIHSLGPEEIYGFILSLVVPNIGYDPDDSVSDDYQKAIDNTEDPSKSTIPTRPHRFLSGDIEDINWGV